MLLIQPVITFIVIRMLLEEMATYIPMDAKIRQIMNLNVATLRRTQLVADR